MAISSEEVDFAKSQIKKAREMIAKANLLLFKVEPASHAETVRLEEITAESIRSKTRRQRIGQLWRS